MRHVHVSGDMEVVHSFDYDIESWAQTSLPLPIAANLYTYFLVDWAVMMLLVLDMMVLSAGLGILLTLTRWKNDNGESLKGKHPKGNEREEDCENC
jgi:hypothetical protein